MSCLKKIVFATQNDYKVKELMKYMAPTGIDVRPLSEFTDEEPEETGLTFKENAVLKARHGWAKTQLPSLGDDSGLVIPVLDGAPGLHSKRWTGPTQDYARAMEKLYQAGILKTNGEPVHAYFICVIALITFEGKHLAFEGRAHGTLVWPPRGTNKFGYDLFFKPDGHLETFGEMSTEEKNRISHRAKALKKFIHFMQTHIPEDACKKFQNRQNL